MPLTSIMLRGNQALQDCLVRDAAHVAPGASGIHVRLIQKCLMLLDSTPIAAAELRSMAYGTSTAATVLSYKRKRRIINTAYQAQADDIVGKMTIARLDEDMLRIERTRTQLVKCEHGGGAGRPSSVAGRVGSSAAGFVETGSPVTAPLVKHHKLLTIETQHTSTSDFSLAHDFVNDLFARARELLRPHGLTLIESELLASKSVPWPEAMVQTQFPADRFAVRKSAVQASPASANILRVIFCPFDEVDRINGITDGGLFAEETVPKFVLINLRMDRRNPDRGTLLHEMVHAAFPGTSPGHDSDVKSVYSASTEREHLRPEHAAQLASSFFARSLR